MGNACQGRLQTGVHHHLDHHDCFVSQQTYCCSGDDDCTDAFEYQRLEGDVASTRPSVDLLVETPNLPDGSECQLPHAAAAAQRAASRLTHSPSASSPLRTQGRKQSKKYGQQHINWTPIGKPAAVALARSRDDYSDKENLPLNELMSEHAPASLPYPMMPYSMLLAPREGDAGTAGEIVTVHLYDLSEALAQINSVSIDLIGYGGALHVGVEVFGIEWSFGTGGVSCSLPKQNRHYVYRQSVDMGTTALTQKDVQQAILSMQREWQGSEYDLFLKNCGTFCNALCIRLGVGSLPAWVTRLAEAGGRSATVRRIADMMAQNGFIGEASPTSQASESQLDHSPQCGSQSSCSEFVSPQSGDLELHADQLDNWLSRLSGDDWLEEELGYQFDSPPLASREQPPPSIRSLQCRSGLSRSTSEQTGLQSPVQGSVNAQRCAAFRAHSYPQMDAHPKYASFKDEDDMVKAFCVKRLALGPRPSYSTDSANVAEAVNSILAEARRGGA